MSKNHRKNANFVKRSEKQCDFCQKISDETQILIQIIAKISANSFKESQKKHDFHQRKANFIKESL